MGSSSFQVVASVHLLPREPSQSLVIKLFFAHHMGQGYWPHCICIKPNSPSAAPIAPHIPGVWFLCRLLQHDGTLLIPKSSSTDISTLPHVVNHSRFSSVEEKELPDICSRELQEANYP